MGPVVLFCFLGLTFYVGLKKNQNSLRVVPRGKNSAVSGLGGGSSAGSGRDTDGNESKSAQPSPRRRCLSHLGCRKKWAPLVPEGMIEEAEKDESDAEQVRGGFRGGRAVGRSVAYDQNVWALFYACFCDAFIRALLG